MSNIPPAPALGPHPDVVEFPTVDDETPVWLDDATCVLDIAGQHVTVEPGASDDEWILTWPNGATGVRRVTDGAVIDTFG